MPFDALVVILQPLVTLDRMKLLLAVLFAFPLFHASHPPAVFRTRIDTTAGSFVIETHRDWSPKGADRTTPLAMILQLVMSGTQTRMK